MMKCNYCLVGGSVCSVGRLWFELKRREIFESSAMSCFRVLTICCWRDLRFSHLTINLALTWAAVDGFNYEFIS